MFFYISFISNLLKFKIIVKFTPDELQNKLQNSFQFVLWNETSFVSIFRRKQSSRTSRTFVFVVLSFVFLKGRLFYRYEIFKVTKFKQKCFSFSYFKHCTYIFFLSKNKVLFLTKPILSVGDIETYMGWASKNRENH